MSIRVMLVDDEPISVQATEVMVAKAGPGLEVVATCFSGREAIRQASLLHPDIVIMDIQMAGINGLEAIRRIRESNPHSRFIILSAYSVFEYAVEALTLGVSGYLLKPVKQTAFTDALLKVADEVQAQKESLDTELKQQERLELAIPMIRRDFISSLAPEENTSERLLACAEFLGIAEQVGAVVIMMQTGEAGQPVPYAPWVQRLGSVCSIAGLCGTDRIVAFELILDRSEYQAHLREVRRRVDDLLAKHQPEGDAFVVGISHAAIGVLNFRVAFQQAEAAIAWRRQVGGPSRSATYMADTMRPLMDQRQQSAMQAQLIPSTRGIVDMAVQYIDEHYQDEITMEEVASRVNLSAYYFSRLFKTHKGVNFTEYLLETRMEQAKILLRSTDSSVKDVAFQVGYRDPNYFSRVFHKTTGLRASTYKALNIKKGGQHG